ncbi:cysteine-rich repeat secretory protein 55-like [Phalaenopsis equestris]|uniref:cysteine-rich repeat secretory protein 55-like n=1 Tax=Phalaenopsis equestris TaxID=78828 RepID=UPI0009E65852|nr:cysteine-rich repeat secretory protein 55-like [Phalaenopsis equestris]
MIARCSANFISQECGKNFSISTYSTLPDSINRAFFGLIAKTSLYGFATASYASGTDAIYGVTRCRGDITLEACSACILEAADNIRTSCPVSAEARIWYEQCFIHYDSNNNFLGQPDTSQVKYYHTTKESTDPTDFNQTLWNVLGGVKSAAATADNRFGRGESKLSNSNMTIYGMAQCTRDLQESACYTCLNVLFEFMTSGKCKGVIGCYAMSISCVLRYEDNPFLEDASPPSSNAYAPASP